MKRRFAVVVTSVTLALPFAAAAQGSLLAHHEGTSVTKADPAMTNGVVRRVDRASGSVTIAHEALTNLGMPGMTMTFLVKERTWLDGLQEGTRIRFAASNVNGTLSVVALEQTK